MVRVVQHNSKQIRCQACMSLLEYTPYDITIQELWWMALPSKRASIMCPVCGAAVEVDMESSNGSD